MQSTPKSRTQIPLFTKKNLLKLALIFVGIYAIDLLVDVIFLGKLFDVWISELLSYRSLNVLLVSIGLVYFSNLKAKLKTETFDEKEEAL